jgi:hypothetical protein
MCIRYIAVSFINGKRNSAQPLFLREMQKRFSKGRNFTEAYLPMKYISLEKAEKFIESACNMSSKGFDKDAFKLARYVCYALIAELKEAGAK